MTRPLAIRVWREHPSPLWFWELLDESTNKAIRWGMAPTETTATTAACDALRQEEESK